MQFSIITPTYNSQKTIKDTLNSVRNQTVQDFEHLIIDGESKDETLNLILENKSENLKIISEKDEGIYDAMNKGVKNSNGEIISILNSDDLYFDNQVLEKVSKVFVENNCDVVYGNIIYVYQDNISKINRTWKTFTIKKWKIWFGWTIPHPAVFVKKEVYHKIGLFDLNFKTASDYDFLLRLMLDSEIKTKYLNENLVRMRSGGVSDGGIWNRLKVVHEVCLSFKKHKNIYPFWFFVTRPSSKLIQFLIR